MGNKLPSSQKEFDEYVQKNLNKWVAEFSVMLLGNSCWDLTFDEFIRYNIWKEECREEIDLAFEDFKEEFPQDVNVTREHIAHDLFLMAKEKFTKNFENTHAQA
jgi:hypothetical protein